MSTAAVRFTPGVQVHAIQAHCDCGWLGERHLVGPKDDRQAAADLAFEEIVVPVATTSTVRYTSGRNHATATATSNHDVRAIRDSATH